MKLEVISREPAEARFETPLLFVHGTGHAAWCWDENFLPFFAKRGFTSHAISLRGHGSSDGADRLKWTRIADYVADVRHVAMQLKRPPVLIGHSLGGLVVMKYLEKYEAPAGVLVAPCPSEGMFRSGLEIQMRNPWLMLKVALNQDYAVMFSTPRLAKKFLFSRDSDDLLVESYSSRFGKESYLAALEMIYNLPDAKKITTSLLVVGAENDALINPAKIEKTARVLNAECEIFPRMAHDMMLERGWREVAEFIADWLGEKIS